MRAGQGVIRKGGTPGVGIIMEVFSPRGRRAGQCVVIWQGAPWATAANLEDLTPVTLAVAP